MRGAQYTVYSPTALAAAGLPVDGSRDVLRSRLTDHYKQRLHQQSWTEVDVTGAGVLPPSTIQRECTSAKSLRLTLLLLRLLLLRVPPRSLTTATHTHANTHTHTHTNTYAHTDTHTHTHSHNHSHCLIWPPRIQSNDGHDEDQES